MPAWKSDTYLIWHPPDNLEMKGVQHCSCAVIIHISNFHIVIIHYHLNNCVTSPRILRLDLKSMLEPVFIGQSHAFMFMHDISNEPWLKGSVTVVAFEVGTKRIPAHPTTNTSLSFSLPPSLSSCSYFIFSLPKCNTYNHPFFLN